jgi:hypothetical protein
MIAMSDIGIRISEFGFVTHPPPDTASEKNPKSEFRIPNFSFL